MKQETKRLSSFVIAALILAGALVVYFQYIAPVYATLETMKGQVESEKALYTNESQIVSLVKGLLSTYQENTSSSSVAMALPVGQDVSGALAQIYGIAANAGVTVQGVGISAQAVAAPGGNNQIANVAMKGSITKPTGTVSFQISGSGSYESIKKLLQGLETNIRIFNVNSISLQSAGIVATKTQAANPDMFNYTITVVTYYQAS